MPGDSKIYLLTFCSLGDPHDKGKDLSSNIAKIKSLLSGYFTDIIIYTPEKIKDCLGSDSFCNPHDGEFPLNPGLNHLGCGDFKSFIIDKTLSEIEEGAILLYHDCNFSKYPQYWQTDWPNLIETCNFFLDANKSDFFAPFESLLNGTATMVKNHGKRITTDAIIKDQTESDIVSECYEIASSRIIIRNTNRSREFFSEYKELCLDKDLLTKFPNPNPYADFTHSCPEQHVLNCLIYSHILRGKLDQHFPRIRFYNRKFRIDDNLKLCRNEKLSKYIDEKVIKQQTVRLYGKDIRGSKEFGENVFST